MHLLATSSEAPKDHASAPKVQSSADVRVTKGFQSSPRQSDASKAGALETAAHKVFGMDMVNRQRVVAVLWQLYEYAASTEAQFTTPAMTSLWIHQTLPGVTIAKRLAQAWVATVSCVEVEVQEPLLLDDLLTGGVIACVCCWHLLPPLHQLC